MTFKNLLESFLKKKREEWFQTGQNTAKATVSIDTCEVRSGHSIWNGIITE